MEHRTETHKEGTIWQPTAHMPGIKADIIGHVGAFPISNTTTFLWFITVLFILFSYLSTKTKLLPGFFQSMFEMLFEAIENLVHSLTGGKLHRVDELLYPIAAIFLIIGSINILGSFPIITQFTIDYVPLFRKATADINTTLGLSIVIVFMMQVFGVRNWGFFGYFKRFVPLHHIWHGMQSGIGGFFMGLIELFVGLLELISEFVKVISLSLRLFGNMFAGEILLAILTGIFAFGLPAVWLGFDFLVAIIQTVVMGCLVAVYYTLVVKEEGQEGH
jgi:F-type H+-transporting ATPase subunit a